MAGRNTLGSLARDDRAAQMVEFAVSLPLLIVFVVGIFDFSGAYTLKQKLTNVARDAARTAAADPANDLQSPSTPVPLSVQDSVQLIKRYFAANNLDDCDILPSGSPTGMTWTFTASTGCPPPGLTITINRAYYFPATGATVPSASCTSQGAGGDTVNTIVGTCVSIAYVYPWRFGRAAQLLGFGQTLPPQITAISVALDEN